MTFPTSVSISTSTFDTVHCDVWGPYRVPNHDGKRYFLSLVDDMSIFIWIFLMNTKSDSIVVLRDFFCMVKTQFEKYIKCLRTDNGTKFQISQVDSLLKKFGTLDQSSCVYSPQQNGVVERRHMSILDMARTLRFQVSIPLKFWGFCVSTAVYILNRFPTMLLKGKSPFEILFGKPPTIQHFRVFGSLCYASDPKKLDKFAPRAIPIVHLGYSSSQKGYVLYDLVSQSFFVSRGIVFKEDIFPFKDLKSSPHPLFPVLTFPDDSPIPCSYVSSPVIPTDAPSPSLLSSEPTPVAEPT